MVWLIKIVGVSLGVNSESRRRWVKLSVCGFRGLIQRVEEDGLKGLIQRVGGDGLKECEG